MLQTFFLPTNDAPPKVCVHSIYRKMHKNGTFTAPHLLTGGGSMQYRYKCNSRTRYVCICVCTVNANLLSPELRMSLRWGGGSLILETATFFAEILRCMSLSLRV